MRGHLVCVVCVVVGLAGCGGGDDSASTSSTTTEATTAERPQSSRQSSASPEKSDEGSAAQGKAKPNASTPDQSNEDKSSSSKPHSHRTKVPPISSAPTAGSRRPAPGVKTVKGADNSVQEYGVESGASERREAAIALQGYLNARATEDWAGACSYLAQRPLEQLERVQSAAAKQGTKLSGCPQTMALLREGEAQTQEQATITEVLSFRGEGDVSGNPSYLLFTAPPSRTLYSMPMYLEAGAWKVGLARAAELAVG